LAVRRVEMGDRAGRPAWKALGIGVVACLISAACSGAVSGTPPTTSSSPAPSSVTSIAGDCLVGEAWDAYAEERIALWDQPAFEKPIEAAGGTYEFADAKSSYDYQAQEVDAFVASGAKVVVVRAVDTVKIVPTVERAAAAGVPVIAYDHLVDSPKALLVAFDPVETGRMEARAILAVKPSGN
jgi:D-xylose transport system substrate-binding protein